MPDRVRRISPDSLTFLCPGCGDHHTVKIGPGGWSWNGSMERPTFNPSVSVKSGHYVSGWKKGDGCWCGKNYPFSCYRCHSFVENGRIRFLGDSTHKLAGQTVDLAIIESESA